MDKILCAMKAALYILLIKFLVFSNRYDVFTLVLNFKFENVKHREIVEHDDNDNSQRLKHLIV
jgi:hypothetical protein